MSKGLLITAALEGRGGGGGAGMWMLPEAENYCHLIASIKNKAVHKHGDLSDTAMRNRILLILKRLEK